MSGIIWYCKVISVTEDDSVSLTHGYRDIGECLKDTKMARINTGLSQFNLGIGYRPVRDNLYDF
jgi:hypothetical protein